MLLELAIGDAYGAGFEYARPSLSRPNDLSGYFAHPRHHALLPGCYTDDTQLSLAIAEAIVADDPWTPRSLAERLLNAFQRDPRPGYAQGFYDFLRTVSDAEDFLRRIRPDSEKNGAAMRATPIGVLPSIDGVLERAEVQARLTHATRIGVGSAQAAALMTHYFLYDLGPKAKLGQFLDHYVPGFDWSEPWSGKVGGAGWMCILAAVTAIQRQLTLSAILTTCIDYGGDVDTVATIAMAAAACSREVVRDLPPALVAGLENGAYGREYIRTLDRELLACVQL